MDNAIPTDSVLRRHYESSHANSTQTKSASQSSGGFMCWLKKIFGG